MIVADAYVNAGRRGFSEGLAYDLARAAAALPQGGILEVVSERDGIGRDLEAWAGLAGHSLVETSRPSQGVIRYLLRKGPVADQDERALGQRLWIYANFECNLACDYCCVRSGPSAEPRHLDPATVGAAASEAQGLGFHQAFITGGEPFLHPQIGAIASACAVHLPTTILTNAMIFQGSRRRALEELPRDRVALQVSLDSPTPEHHDRHRGPGSWKRAREGIDTARALGFRVRIAATGVPEALRNEMTALLDELGIPAEDRILRPVARRGNATQGILLSRPDLQPELTLTARGTYWHPVGATDEDFLITRNILPLSQALADARTMMERDQAFAKRLMEVFNCG